MSTLVVIGLGYSASRIVAEVSSRFDRIIATVRDPVRAAALSAGPLEVVAFDGTAAVPRLAEAVRSADAILISAPPRLEGDDPLLAHHRADLDVAPDLAWVGYLSTVGVYGDAGGGWVDETSTCWPLSPRSAARVAVERAWTAFAASRCVPAVLFRLSGIYGPGQNALVQVKGGTAKRIVKPGQVFNRIHVDDIAGAVAASLARPDLAGALNVTDDMPAPPQDVIAYAAALLGVSPPPELDWQTALATLSPMARSFWAESKRVSNRRLREDLGYRLRYPDYRAGLTALRAELAG